MVRRYTIDQIKAVLQDSAEVDEAAKRLGIPARSVRRQCQDAGIGSPSLWLGKMRLRGVSTRRNGRGETEQEWQKTERAPVPDAHQIPPEDFQIASVSTMRDREGQTLVQWVREEKQEAIRLEQFWTAAEKASARVITAPAVADTVAHRVDTLLSVYPLGDPHIGQLSWGRETGADFDLQIACKELLAAVRMLVSSAPASRVGVLAPLGDYFHAEDDNQVTPRNKHKLDVDTRADKVTEAGFFLLETMALALLEKHEEVRVAIVGGNHDPKLARLMRMWAQAVFRNHPRVTILDNRDPYIYIPFGRTLLGFAHGDSASDKDLPGIMAEYREGSLWGAARHRYWHRGHRHSDSLTEYRGCLVEGHQTLAPRDYYAQHAGYRSKRGLKVITYDQDHGEISRARVDIRQVQMQIGETSHAEVY